METKHNCIVIIVLQANFQGTLFAHDNQNNSIRLERTLHVHKSCCLNHI